MNQRHEPIVQMVPIDQITIVNHRSRGKPKFQQIAESIATVGLKKPITVARRGTAEGKPRYDLVCGQGRLEAIKAQGLTEVAAMVIDVSKEDLLLMSLVENLARRQFTGLDAAREIVALRDRGYTAAQIAKKTGLTSGYVSGIVRLFKQGEERLIEAVERQQLPLSVAVDISAADDQGVQRALAEAYENEQLRGKALIQARRLVEQRRVRGKQLHGPGSAGGKGPSNAEQLMRTYRDETARQQLLVQKRKLCERRLLFIISALRQLLADENFVTLLRAEGMDSLPQQLVDRLAAERT